MRHVENGVFSLFVYVWAGVAILCMYVSYGYIHNHVTWWFMY